MGPSGASDTTTARGKRPPAAGATPSSPPPAAPATAPAPQAAATDYDGPLTLAIDVGGTRLKAGVLDANGQMVAGPVRTDTPKPATPSAVLAGLVSIVSGLRDFDRISVGFPGVVRHGRVRTAPNLGNEYWSAFPLAGELTNRFGKPTRLLNDGGVQGLGVITGTGLECVITLGTGMGFALFQDGYLAPHLEMGQHIARKDKTYDMYVGNAAYLSIGAKRWNRRVQRVIAALETLTDFDTLFIGGGNGKHITFELPPKVRVVPNEAGITGGVRLWDPKMDNAFELRPES